MEVKGFNIFENVLETLKDDKDLIKADITRLIGR